MSLDLTELQRTGLTETRAAEVLIEIPACNGQDGNDPHASDGCEMCSLHSREGALAAELAAATEDPSSGQQVGGAGAALEALLVELRRVKGEGPMPMGPRGADHTAVAYLIGAVVGYHRGDVRQGAEVSPSEEVHGRCTAEPIPGSRCSA